MGSLADGLKICRDFVGVAVDLNVEKIEDIDNLSDF